MQKLPDMSHLDPVDRREVERFADYLREAGEIRRRGNPEGITWGELYDEMYPEEDEPQPIGKCPKCGADWYTDAGFCGGCHA